MEDKQKVFIKGDSKRGEEVIKLLIDLGGQNSLNFYGDNNFGYYYISPNGEIWHTCSESSAAYSFIKEFYKEIKLPRWKPACNGEKYFYVSDGGIVLQETWKNNSDDGWRYTFGNCFKTYNEAAEVIYKFEKILNN